MFLNSTFSFVIKEKAYDDLNFQETLIRKLIDILLCLVQINFYRSFLRILILLRFSYTQNFGSLSPNIVAGFQISQPHS